MRWTSGLFWLIALAMDCMIIVLPALDGETIETALALADGRHQVDDPADQVGGPGLQLQPLLRVERGQLAELDAVLRVLRVAAVDGLELDQRVELLLAVAVLGRADLRR